MAVYGKMTPISSNDRNIFFTSDTHFGHEKIITMCHRPFSSAQQMEEEIIKKWNAKIKSNDLVYVLGDVCWGWNSNRIKELLTKLNGIKSLVYGNHDNLTNHEISNCWQSIEPYKELLIDNRKVILSHYPLADWNGAYRGDIHLYGHVHGNFDLAKLADVLPHHNKRCMDVGMDTNNCEPWSWNEIKKHLGVE